MKPDPERIAAYLAGELPPTEAEAFEREMETNPSLRSEVDSMRGLLDEVREWMLADAPGSERVEMEATFAFTNSSFPQRRDSTGTSGSHWRYVLQALAACLIFYLGYALGIATTAPPSFEELAPPLQLVAHAPQATPAPSVVPAAIDEPTPPPSEAEPARLPVRTQAVDEGGRLVIETTLAGSTSRAVWVVDGNFRLEQPGT